MNYNKVIKDLKERNDKLQEQYRLRDIRCIHLEYENEMLKSDFKAQHELTKKYAEESKELKQKYLNAVADYETTMAEKEQLNSLVNSCQEEIRQLKKQLEENKDKINWYENFEINKTIDKLRIKHNNQQKEFIKYLEDEIKRINPKNLYISELNLRLDDIKFTQYLIYKEILQKYKELIGDDK